MRSFQHTLSGKPLKRILLRLLGKQLDRVGDQMPVDDVLRERRGFQSRYRISGNFQNGVVLSKLQIDVDPILALRKLVERSEMAKFTDLSINRGLRWLFLDKGETQDLLAARFIDGIRKSGGIPVEPTNKATSFLPILSSNCG